MSEPFVVNHLANHRVVGEAPLNRPRLGPAALAFLWFAMVAAMIGLLCVFLVPGTAWADTTAPAGPAPSAPAPAPGAGTTPTGTSSINTPPPVQPTYSYVPSGTATGTGTAPVSPTTSPSRPLAEGLGLAALVIVLVLYTEGFGVLGGRILPMSSRRRQRRTDNAGQDAGPTVSA